MTPERIQTLRETFEDLAGIGPAKDWPENRAAVEEVFGELEMTRNALRRIVARLGMFDHAEIEEARELLGAEA